MRKNIAVLIISSFVALALPVSVIAKNATVVKTTKVLAVTATASPSPAPVTVNSFELFWPMSAGKTMQSKVYFLKILKENVRGFFIFGSAQKADYNIFLTIKRMLEAETLMKANVTDLANKTLDSATNDLDKANSSLNSAKNSSDIDQTTKDEVNIRVANLKKFTLYLINQYPSYKDKLQGVMGRLNTITI